MVKKYMNPDLACEIEEEGIVLVKNDGVLPFQSKDKALVIGERSRYPMLGGGGSSEVYVEEYIDIYHGLKEYADLGKVTLLNANDALLDYKKLIDEQADENTTVVYTIARFSTEGEDLKSLSLSDLDREILAYIERSKTKNVCVLLNVPTFFWASELDAYSKVKSVLFIYYGGMYVGRAVAKILTGAVCPSGRLPSTIAYSEKDYPSNDGFFEEEGAKGFRHFDEAVDENAKRTNVVYKEDIFVGYRYFEENEERKKKVVYPFGFGLSYTDFQIDVNRFDYGEETVKICLNVKNVGALKGKETAQLYVKLPDGEPVSPALELVDFFKTKELQAGESERVEFDVEISRFRCFDERENAYILKKGEYRLYIGTSARNVRKIGRIEVKERKIVRRSQEISRGIPSYPYVEDGGEAKLSDVAQGKLSLREFAYRLSTEDLIGLTQSKEPALPGGTGCFGKIYGRGIPDIQSTDGPAGIRRAGTNATYYPCATACASTWNKDLMRRMGESLGEEAIALHTDVLLAPGVNLHRHPFCGRNFEYFSEDPFLAGRMAAEYVNGIQSKGIGACVKHFVANNKEDNRKDSNSILSERALRDLYLKVFEITLTYSNPWCVMTSYNILNGVRCSANEKILRKVLRGDFGFNGLIMTDWEVASSLKEELLAGSNLKNPCGHPEKLAKLLEEVQRGEISRDVLAESAEYMLSTVMKTKKFKDGNWDKRFFVKDGATLDATVTSTVSSTWAQSRRYDSGFGHCLTNMVRDGRGNLPTAEYRLNVEKGGKYELTALLSGKAPSARITVFLDGKEQGVLTLGETPSIAGKAKRDCTVERKCEIELPTGHCNFTIFFNEDTESYYSVEIGTFSFKKISN